MGTDNYGTSGGVELTDELINKLADEAEKGYDLDKVDPGYEMFPGISKNCLFCGAKTPPGHVIVFTGDEKAAGRVCSHHTLKELILDAREEFDVLVTYTGG